MRVLYDYEYCIHDSSGHTPNTFVCGPRQGGSGSLVCGLSPCVLPLGCAPPVRRAPRRRPYYSSLTPYWPSTTLTGGMCRPASPWQQSGCRAALCQGASLCAAAGPAS